MKVAIAGAGIGGLTLALALAQRGIQSDVFEQAEALGDVGAGLQLSPNAMQVFETLGIAQDIARIACRPEALELRLGHSGTRIFSIPMGEVAVARYGAPYLHVHRADLIAVLARAVEAAPGVRLNLGARVIEGLESGGGVKVGLSTGQVVASDLLVGADGIHSVVRAKVVGKGAPVFTGCVAWRMTVPMRGLEACFPEPRATVWVGPGRHAVTYPVRDGELVNFVGVIEQDGWSEESWSEAGDIAELRAAFEGWAEPVRAVLEAGTSCFRWALFDRDPIETWSARHMTLMGDACHPMPPFQAQGAAMAIEDAWALADCLDSVRGISESLAMYGKRRAPRANKVAQSARANRGIFHRRTKLGQLATYGPMWLADRVLPWVVRGRQDWIYRYDETQIDS